MAAQRLVHGDWGGLYTKPTSLVGLPGAAVILAPAAVIIDAAGLSLQIPGPHNPYPAVWLLAGPYEIALSAVALFAADAIAEHLGVTRPRRALLAAASAVALWSVAVRWGHPEDAVAVGLLLYGILALSRSTTGRSGWLIGAAVAMQPLVLLALPFAAVVIAAAAAGRLPGPGRRPRCGAAGAAAAANWHATVSAVTSQPNSVTVNHSTPGPPWPPTWATGRWRPGRPGCWPSSWLADARWSPGAGGARRCAAGWDARSCGSCCGGPPWRWRCAACSSR